MSKQTAVIELGYMGISVKDPDAWKSFATDMLGLQVLDEGEKDRFYLRMDYWHHRIVVHHNGQDDLEYLGWRVAGKPEFEALGQKLIDAGYKIRICDKVEAQERMVLGLMKTEDPGGNPTEIFWGPRIDMSNPFHPGRPLHGKFVTGDQGLGHCIVRQTDVAEAHKFYSLLGFRGDVEYRIPLPNGMTAELSFMHCNARDHSIAFGAMPAAKRLNHLMLEYTHMEDLGYTHQQFVKNEIDIALQLGIHANDKALTFYGATPSGWLIEPGWRGATAIDEAEYYVGDIFGHGVEATGYGLDVKLS
ncbi:1,2-dihydroxynaphthalene dioxygenase [Pseudomonas veronii]|uniref:1,2-dihydroxynaphthalene dioxygenase n=1 Tax=Pseudomonas veronii TaxID=76761 RepID=A0A4P7YDF8_PSEVE|nr:1,2-dihydroxynaphthalene dioxygenase [Pseudomonas veronii]QCG68883.1 2,3-dihydroxybiphenyl 1,2-dioxygenase [Pseudomonas veronii]